MVHSLACSIELWMHTQEVRRGWKNVLSLYPEGPGAAFLPKNGKALKWSQSKLVYNVDKSQDNLYLTDQK